MILFIYSYFDKSEMTSTHCFLRTENRSITEFLISHHFNASVTFLSRVHNVCRNGPNYEIKLRSQSTDESGHIILFEKGKVSMTNPQNKLEVHCNT